MTMEMPQIHSGKVRELYDAGDGRLLMVASDRVSAFDVIMAEPIANKGRVLTAMTSFWCDEMADVVPGAQITADPVAIADALGGIDLPPDWAGRAVLVHAAEMLHLECIVRGYLAGSAYAEYERSGTVHGMTMPAGLQLASKLPEPIFTPSTKATEGHDLNIDFGAAVDLVGAEAALQARHVCLELYRRAAARCAEAGFVLADTKFELGYVGGVLTLCDEVHARLLTAVAGRPGGAWSDAARLRQAAPAGLAGGPALGPHAAPAPAARRGHRGPVGPLRRRLRPRRRALVGRLVRCDAMRFQARVEVQLRPGIADPEGATIERALPALGFGGVAHVRAGRSFSFEVDAADEGAARTTASELADRLLANPVIEQSTLEIREI
jgi:phosphoribosylaminoimidazole-succinocarboxamide synthase